jgi:hypothetical protein
MFLRFVTSNMDADSEAAEGLFTAAYRLRDQHCLPSYQQRRLGEILAWFSRSLPVPGRFSRSKSRSEKTRGVCWFKPTAHECL